MTTLTFDGVQLQTVPMLSNVTFPSNHSTATSPRSIVRAATSSVSAAPRKTTDPASADSSSSGSRSVPTIQRRPTGSAPTPKSVLNVT